ncbi:hypothetical protein Q7P37_010384 [Cladosporium fusiforme]
MGSITTTKPASFFAGIPAIKPDAIFALTAEFHEDGFGGKVNLGQGTYRDENGQPFVLPSVRKAREILMASDLKHEYLAIPGLAEFRVAAAEVALGGELFAGTRHRIATCQSLSGTGALHLTGLFLKRYAKVQPDVYISDPSWSNHQGVFSSLGFNCHTFRYMHPDRNELDFESFCSMLDSAAPGSIVVLHACAHNPTGYDPTPDQWSEIGRRMKSRGLFPIFDSAYLGFNSGNVSQDAWAIRHFVDDLEMEVAICMSFAKNMGLYGERVGCVAIVSQDEVTARNTQSVLESLQRMEISNPPAWGARVASTVLNNKAIRSMWEADLITMSTRIRRMRNELHEALGKHRAPGSWDHLIAQSGMFGFLKLKPEVVQQLKNEYHIYMAENSRISIAGLNPSNVDYVASSIAKRSEQAWGLANADNIDSIVVTSFKHLGCMRDEHDWVFEPKTGHEIRVHLALVGLRGAKQRSTAHSLEAHNYVPTGLDESKTRTQRSGEAPAFRLFARATYSNALKSIIMSITYPPPPAGVYAPMVTFFHDDETVNYASITQHVQFLAASGVAGLVIHGSNGEATHLSHEERETIITHVRRVLLDSGYRCTIIAGCSANSVRETLEYTAEAKAAGADFSLVLPPNYWAAAMSPATIKAFYSQVAEKSPLPLLIYNFPGVTAGIDISSDLGLQLANAHSNIVGIKLTCGNVGKLARLAAGLPRSRFAVFAGKADFIVAGLVAGSGGGISALANVAPRVHIEAVRLFEQGDIARARELQFKLANADGELTKLGVSGVKTAVKLAHNYGSSRARAPLPNSTIEREVDLHKDIRAVIELERDLAGRDGKAASSNL